MRALIVEYHGPTETRGARFYVKDGSNVTRHKLDSELEGERAYADAAIKHCRKFGWVNMTLQAGGLKNGDYVFTFIDPPAQYEVRG